MSNLICELPKNSREKLVFNLSEFRGKQYLDMRIYVAGENGQDIPTKKGITLSVGLYPQFRAALAQVEAAMIEAGWLDREDLAVND